MTQVVGMIVTFEITSNLSRTLRGHCEDTDEPGRIGGRSKSLEFVNSFGSASLRLIRG